MAGVCNYGRSNRTLLINYDLTTLVHEPVGLVGTILGE